MCTNKGASNVKKQDLVELAAPKKIVKPFNWTIPYTLACFVWNVLWQFGLAAGLKLGWPLLAVLSGLAALGVTPVSILFVTQRLDGDEFSPKWVFTWMGTALAAMVPTVWWMSLT
jgi:hypothetical protein